MKAGKVGCGRRKERRKKGEMGGGGEMSQRVGHRCPEKSGA